MVSCRDYLEVELNSICKKATLTVLLFVVTFGATLSYSRPLGEWLFSNKKYQEQIDVQAAYFWLNDVGDVFSGKKDWHATQLSDKDLDSQTSAYDFAIVIRVRNKGKVPAWGRLEVRTKKDATNELTISIPTIYPSDPWSLYVVTHRHRLLLGKYLLDGPYLTWSGLYTK